LTGPCEENFSARHEDKIRTPLKELCEEAKWTCDLFAFEVGASQFWLENGLFSKYCKI